MGTSYHSFCPVAKAVELLDERWTMLVVNELRAGPLRFNELRRELPRMSPTLLSKRLQQLTIAGVAAHEGDAYRLTEAGEELGPIIAALGAWGVRWIGEIGDQELDPKLLMWALHSHIEHHAVPAGRTVVEFRFSDVRRPNRPIWWLTMTPEEADVCDSDPGYPVSLTVDTTLRRMIHIYLGDATWATALRDSSMTLHGPSALRRALPTWIRLSSYASVVRPVAA